MDRTKKTWTLGEIADLLGGEPNGPAGLVIRRPVPADSDDPEGITFATSARYLERAESSGVGAILVSGEFVSNCKPCIVVPDPRIAFGRLLELWRRPLPLSAGIHAQAWIDPGATVHETARIGPFAVIEAGALVGPNARIYPFAYIGEECQVGEGAIVYPHAVLYQGVILGPRTIVHAGAILGADGFGFEWDGSQHVKVPHIGTVETGANVEIGANTCIDRATAGTTALGDGTKLDNLVQIGHNVRVGKDSVIAGMTGLSGSATVGDRVVIGGAVAITDHVNIASDVSLGGRTGVAADITEPGQYWGTPAKPMLEAMKTTVLVGKLPELLARIRALEKKIEELEDR